MFDAFNHCATASGLALMHIHKEININVERVIYIFVSNVSNAQGIIIGAFNLFLTAFNLFLTAFNLFLTAFNLLLIALNL